MFHLNSISNLEDQYVMKHQLLFYVTPIHTTSAVGATCCTGDAISDQPPETEQNH